MVGMRYPLFIRLHIGDTKQMHAAATAPAEVRTQVKETKKALECRGIRSGLLAVRGAIFFETLPC